MINQLKDICRHRLEILALQLCRDELEFTLFEERFLKNSTTEEISKKLCYNERYLKFRFKRLKNRFMNIPRDIIYNILYK